MGVCQACFIMPHLTLVPMVYSTDRGRGGLFMDGCTRHSGMLRMSDEWAATQGFTCKGRARQLLAVLGSWALAGVLLYVVHRVGQQKVQGFPETFFK